MLRTKFQLMTALFGRGDADKVTVMDRATGTPRTGILQAAEREDGSGNCFNLTVRWESGRVVTVFWRSED
jgi:hypothetical protein